MMCFKKIIKFIINKTRKSEKKYFKSKNWHDLEKIVKKKKPVASSQALKQSILLTVYFHNRDQQHQHNYHLASAAHSSRPVKAKVTTGKSKQ